MSPEQVALFLEPPSRPPGLNLDTQGLRTYTNGTLAAHVLGNIHRMDDDMGKEEPDVDFDYCLPDYEGQVGIEATFDKQLRGHAGAQSLIVNNKGYRQSETVWIPPDSGMNVVLTVDARIQKAAETTAREARKGWAALIREVHELDPLCCPRCVAELKIIAFIERHHSLPEPVLPLRNPRGARRRLGRQKAFLNEIHPQRGNSARFHLERPLAFGQAPSTSKSQNRQNPIFTLNGPSRSGRFLACRKSKISHRHRRNREHGRTCFVRHIHIPLCNADRSSE